MNKLRLVMSALLTTSVLLGFVGSAHAQTVVNDPKCEAEVYARSYSVGADTVTANFEVKKVTDGVGNCTKDVTVAAWNAPNGVDGVPFDKQTFVDSKSGTFPVGFHSLTVKKPQCFYQVDLLRGLSPFGANGGGVNYVDWQYVSSAHGGQECKPAPTPQPVKPAAVVTTGKLPNTGVGDVIPVAVVAGTGAGIMHRIRSRKHKR